MMMSSHRSGSESVVDPFEQLHPGVQRWVWQQGWPALRQIQAQAIPLVLGRQSDVVISAPTAGGKTEAAFLPIMTDLAQFEGPGLRCLCVSPLRALINDQTRRLISMAEAVDLRVQPWHGDVSAGRASFWKRPANILITTPESLEALLMRRGAQFGGLLGELRYLVVDELHAFFGSERGAQLRSLLQRVERLAPDPLPRIALSATLGEPARAAAFLRPHGGFPSQVLTSASDGGELRLQVRAIQQHRDQEDGQVPSMEAAGHAVGRLLAQIARQPVDRHDPLPAPPETFEELEDSEEAPADRYTTALDEVSDHLFERLRGESHLVFANARAQVEIVADQLRERAEAKALPNEFFPHHGALSRELRLSVEERLRDGKLPTTAVCTSTLEMGVDLGDVESVAQIGPAPSVASLKQRIGRSGRRPGQPQILRQYVVLPALTSRSHPVEWLRLPLLQAIAAIELMLAGRFEPPTQGDLHLSTLVQQILSFIAQSGGGCSAAELYRELCLRGAFSNIDQATFADLLRSLGSAQVIEQVDDGSLLPGAMGERLMGHFSFYATFFTPEEYQLLCNGKRLGTVPVIEPLVPGRLMLFAGRRWRILEVDTQARVVLLTPAKGGKPPSFGGGSLSVHGIVHQRMRELLEESSIPVYLDAVAQQGLLDAREAYSLFGFDQSPLIASGDAVHLAHWAGHRVSLAIVLWLQWLEVEAVSAGPFVEINGVTEDDVPKVIEAALQRVPADSMILALQKEGLVRNKFDQFLQPDLLVKGYAAAELDLEGAIQVMKQWHTALGQRAPFAN